MGVLFVSFSAFAGDQTLERKTPRGAMIKLDVYNPGLSSVLLLGQGQGCGARNDLYDAIGAEAKTHGFTVVRLVWAYCVADPKNGDASEDLSKEQEDFLTALNVLRIDLKFSDNQIVIGGKSLGTLVSAKIFATEKLLSGLVLLTPVCTDYPTSNNPPTEPHKNSFAYYYPGLDLESRPVLFAQGSKDPICENVHFLEYLKGKKTNFISLVVEGNHRFAVENPDGKVNEELTKRNFLTVARWIFSQVK